MDNVFLVQINDPQGRQLTKVCATLDKAKEEFNKERNQMISLYESMGYKYHTIQMIADSDCHLCFHDPRNSSSLIDIYIIEKKVLI